MDAGLAIAVFLALGFAVTNGLHDASNAIATLVATRAARPSQAIVLAAFFNSWARCCSVRLSPTRLAGS